MATPQGDTQALSGDQRYRALLAVSEGAWSGPAALELWHHALAPVAQLPVREVISGAHLLTDLTLGLGTLVHDYLTGWVPKPLSNAYARAQ